MPSNPRRPDRVLARHEPAKPADRRASRFCDHPGVTDAHDTIVAIATAPAAGGVGIVRLSGPRAQRIAEAISGKRLAPRRARYARFQDLDGETIDDGIALYFAGPASFTGEDVAELQAHGSPVVLRQLVARCIALGARQARAGEFSERAFLNGKLDLAQAEAIADLIAAGDAQAARAARRSLDGVFSQRVEALMAALLAIRVHVEAAIDFADEPLDTLGGGALRERLDAAIGQLAQLQREAERGQKLRDGLHVVLVGPPNAGKSSLLNALAGSERAIVTDLAGTTRDLLHETIRLDGVELTLVDTAGLREAGDAIEAEGIRRARSELARADLALVVLDARAPGPVGKRWPTQSPGCRRCCGCTTRPTCWRRRQRTTTRPITCGSRPPPALAWMNCIAACWRCPRAAIRARAPSARARGMCGHWRWPANTWGGRGRTCRWNGWNLPRMRWPRPIQRWARSVAGSAPTAYWVTFSAVSASENKPNLRFLLTNARHCRVLVVGAFASNGD